MARKSPPGRGQVSHLDWTEALARARCQYPAWVIVRNEDGTYTARRAFWGNQQLITVPTLGELEARLQALQPDPVGHPLDPRPAPGLRKDPRS